MSSTRQNGPVDEYHKGNYFFSLNDRILNRNWDIQSYDMIRLEEWDQIHNQEAKHEFQVTFSQVY